MCECGRCKKADEEIEKVDAARASAASAGYDRVAIVNDMCRTWRHDYDLVITEDQRTIHGKILSGMTPRERSGMFAMMNQVFEHNIKPLLDRS